MQIFIAPLSPSERASTTNLVAGVNTGAASLCLAVGQLVLERILVLLIGLDY